MLKLLRCLFLFVAVIIKYAGSFTITNLQTVQYRYQRALNLSYVDLIRWNIQYERWKSQSQLKSAVNNQNKKEYNEQIQTNSLDKNTSSSQTQEPSHLNETVNELLQQQNQTSEVQVNSSIVQLTAQNSTEVNDKTLQLLRYLQSKQGRPQKNMRYKQIYETFIYPYEVYRLVGLDLQDVQDNLITNKNKIKNSSIPDSNIDDLSQINQTADILNEQQINKQAQDQNKIQGQDYQKQKEQQKGQQQKRKRGRISPMYLFRKIKECIGHNACLLLKNLPENMVIKPSQPNQYLKLHKISPQDFIIESIKVETLSRDNPLYYKLNYLTIQQQGNQKVIRNNAQDKYISKKIHTSKINHFNLNVNNYLFYAMHGIDKGVSSFQRLLVSSQVFIIMGDVEKWDVAYNGSAFKYVKYTKEPLDYLLTRETNNYQQQIQYLQHSQNSEKVVNKSGSNLQQQQYMKMYSQQKQTILNANKKRSKIQIPAKYLKLRQLMQLRNRKNLDKLPLFEARYGGKMDGKQDGHEKDQNEIYIHSLALLEIGINQNYQNKPYYLKYYTLESSRKQGSTSQTGAKSPRNIKDKNITDNSSKNTETNGSTDKLAQTQPNIDCISEVQFRDKLIGVDQFGNFYILLSEYHDNHQVNGKINVGDGDKGKSSRETPQKQIVTKIFGTGNNQVILSQQIVHNQFTPIKSLTLGQKQKQTHVQDSSRSHNEFGLSFSLSYQMQYFRKNMMVYYKVPEEAEHVEGGQLTDSVPKQNIGQNKEQGRRIKPADSVSNTSTTNNKVNKGGTTNNTNNKTNNNDNSNINMNNISNDSNLDNRRKILFRQSHSRGNLMIKQIWAGHIPYPGIYKCQNCVDLTKFNAANTTNTSTTNNTNNTNSSNIINNSSNNINNKNTTDVKTNSSQNTSNTTNSTIGDTKQGKEDEEESRSRQIQDRIQQVIKIEKLYASMNQQKIPRSHHYSCAYSVFNNVSQSIFSKQRPANSTRIYPLGTYFLAICYNLHLLTSDPYCQIIDTRCRCVYNFSILISNITQPRQPSNNITDNTNNINQKAQVGQSARDGDKRVQGYELVWQCKQNQIYQHNMLIQLSVQSQANQQEYMRIYLNTHRLYYYFIYQNFYSSLQKSPSPPHESSSANLEHHNDRKQPFYSQHQEAIGSFIDYHIGNVYNHQLEIQYEKVVAMESGDPLDVTNVYLGDWSIYLIQDNTTLHYNLTYNKTNAKDPIQQQKKDQSKIDSNRKIQQKQDQVNKRLLLLQQQLLAVEEKLDDVEFNQSSSQIQMNQSTYNASEQQQVEHNKTNEQVNKTKQNNQSVVSQWLRNSQNRTRINRQKLRQLQQQTYFNHSDYLNRSLYKYHYGVRLMQSKLIPIFKRFELYTLETSEQQQSNCQLMWGDNLKEVYQEEEINSTVNSTLENSAYRFIKSYERRQIEGINMGKNIANKSKYNESTRNLWRICRIQIDTYHQNLLIQPTLLQSQPPKLPYRLFRCSIQNSSVISKCHYRQQMLDKRLLLPQNSKSIMYIINMGETYNIKISDLNSIQMNKIAQSFFVMFIGLSLIIVFFTCVLVCRPLFMMLFIYMGWQRGNSEPIFRYPLNCLQVKLKIRRMVSQNMIKITKSKQNKKQGAQQHQQSQEQQNKYQQQGDDCAFCLQNKQVGQQLIETFCKHSYHKQCFEQWVKYESGQLSCPMCKRRFSAANLIE